MNTAMQMAIEHYENLSAQGSNEAYVIAKFLKEKFLLIETQQIIKSNRDGVDMAVDKKPFITGEEYYNSTYVSKGSDGAEPKNYYYGTDEFGTYCKIYCKNKEQTLYTEEQVIEFTMKMISQYVFGNTNIWDRNRLKESLLLKQPKQDEITFGDLRDVDVDSYMKGYNRAVKGQELQHKQPKKD